MKYVIFMLFIPIIIQIIILLLSKQVLTKITDESSKFDKKIEEYQEIIKEIDKK